MAPSGSGVVVTGLAHATYAPASTAHSYLAPSSLALNWKTGVLSLVLAGGPALNVVFGAVTSRSS